MKKIYKILSLIIFSVLTFTSCIKTEEVETTPECAINTFSIGDIKSQVKIKREGLSDTTVTRIISGSSVYFNIDQINGIITTVDSIASWADLSKIKPSFTANGIVYARIAGEENFYHLTSGADSLSIEKPLELFVIASNGVSKKNYTVSIKKSTTDNDDLKWNKTISNLSVENDFKTFALNNNIYAFSKRTDAKTYVTYSSVQNKLVSWSTPVSVDADIDYSSVTIFNGEFYALSADKYIYKAQDSNNPISWNKVSEKKFTQLLSADKYYIYATDGYEILSSTDLQNWTSNGSNDIDMLPNRCVNYHSYTSKTNPNIEISTMCGISDNNTVHGTSWYKISSNDEDINQNWMYIQITKDNPYGLPLFKDMSSTYYNGNIYAIGIDSNTDKYQYLYKSSDNGITWKAMTTSYVLPTDIDASAGIARIVTANDKVWIIQKGGNIWSGTIK